MTTKTVPSKMYFCSTIQTTLNHMQEIAGTEVDCLYAEIGKLGVKAEGSIEFIYFDSTSDVNKPFTLHIAMPVSDSIPIENKKFEFIEFGEFKSASHLHKGDISNLYGVYQNIYNDLLEKGLRPTNQIREVYEKFIEPQSADNITEIQIGIQ